MKKNKGFTIMELIVAIGIATIILGAVYGALAVGNRSWLIQAAQLAVQQEARFGLDKMSRELRLASFATITKGNIINFSMPIDSDGNGFLDMYNGTSTVVYGADNQPDWKISYLIDRDNQRILRRVINGSTEESNITIVTGINNTTSATYFSDDTNVTNGNTFSGINITLTTEKNTIQGRNLIPPLRLQLKTTAKLRNSD